MNGPVGRTQPPTQLAANRGQEPDGNAGEFGRHYGEVRRGQSVTHEVRIRDDRRRARPRVEQGKLSEHRAGSKCRKADIRVGQVEISASAALDNDQKFISGIAFAKDYAARAGRTRAASTARLPPDRSD